MLQRGCKEIIESKVQDITISLSREDYLDIPETRTVDEEITLPPRIRKQYDQLQKDFLLEIGDEEIVSRSAAALIGKLLQFAGGTVYSEEKEVLFVHDEKIKRLRKIVKDHDEPLLVVTAYKHERARILKEFPEAQMFNEKDLGAWQRKEIPIWVD